jgi:hypothetical protein
VHVRVVIPALNEERDLGQLLSDIQRQSLRPEKVIVVDDFGEAYLVHFTWDIKRMVTSVALLAWMKAIVGPVVPALVRSASLGVSLDCPPR